MHTSQNCNLNFLIDPTRKVSFNCIRDQDPNSSISIARFSHLTKISPEIEDIIKKTTPIKDAHPIRDDKAFVI